MTSSMNNTQNIIIKTQQDYNTIASHFDQKRSVKRSLARFEWLLAYLPQSDLRVLDVGCGNARMIDFFKAHQIKLKDYLGVDISDKLIEIAKHKYPHHQFLVKNMVEDSPISLFNKTKYNLALFLAVLHHLPSKNSQLKALRNICQVLDENGLLVITVWNLWQKKFWLEHLKQLPFKIKNKNLNYLIIPYKISDGKKIIKQVNRFLYSFDNPILNNLLTKASFKIIDCFYITNNKKSNILSGYDLCFVARKC